MCGGSLPDDSWYNPINGEVEEVNDYDERIEAVEDEVRELVVPNSTSATPASTARWRSWWNNFLQYRTAVRAPPAKFLKYSSYSYRGYVAPQMGNVPRCLVRYGYRGAWVHHRGYRNVPGTTDVSGYAYRTYPGRYCSVGR